MRLYGMLGQSSSMTAKPIVHKIDPVANTGRLCRPIKHSGAKIAARRPNCVNPE